MQFLVSSAPFALSFALSSALTNGPWTNTLASWRHLAASCSNPGALTEPGAITMMGLAISEYNILMLRGPMRLAHSMVSLLGLGAVHVPAVGL